MHLVNINVCEPILDGLRDDEVVGMCARLLSWKRVVNGLDARIVRFLHLVRVRGYYENIDVLLMDDGVVQSRNHPTACENDAVLFGCVRCRHPRELDILDDVIARGLQQSPIGLLGRRHDLVVEQKAVFVVQVDLVVGSLKWRGQQEFVFVAVKHVPIEYRSRAESIDGHGSPQFGACRVHCRGPLVHRELGNVAHEEVVDFPPCDARA